MIKGVKYLKKFIVSALAAAFIISAVPTTAVTVNAATKVDVNETTQVLSKRGVLVYKATGNSMVTITPGVYAKNVLSVTINDEDAKIKNIKCSSKLRYKLTYREYEDKTDSVTYRFSFFTKTAKRYKFKFKVDDQEYSIFINATTPVARATFAGQDLSTKYGLGTVNYVTELSKGKFAVQMGKGYTLESVQVGRYKNVTNESKEVHPTLYWTTSANNKTIKLSGEKQVSEDRDILESSMYATTIIRVNYRYTKNNTTGCVDYYLNKIVDSDN
ncbi:MULTISPECIES: hypothetical protein [unclassified Butyrivibrio]|uniref:hypothetical protein n=1 Tax=unclassified Butyrivibrio TaxID=2639466 RepID=UPI0003B35C7C|nr:MULTISPECIES: hypothetical protein [unclassified Butyrivibrio]